MFSLTGVFHSFHTPYYQRPAHLHRQARRVLRATTRLHLFSRGSNVPGMGLFNGKAPGELVKRLDELEAELKALRMEWAEVQDKVYRWMQRTRARDAVDGPKRRAAPMHPAVERIMRRRGMLATLQAQAISAREEAQED